MKLRIPLLLAAALVAVAACDKSKPPPTPQAPAAAAAKARPRPEDNNVYKVPLEDSVAWGGADALITVVEFSDYQCPFCARANATVDELKKAYEGKLRLVMKHNPLPFHPRAKPAALAALAAGEQGKFWEFHQKLFANNKALEDADLERYAQELGLDVAKWKQSMADAKWAAVIDRDQTLARKLGASGTPAFFINGRKLVGAQPIENFKSLVDEEMTKADLLVKSGVPAGSVYAKAIEKGLENAPTPPPAAVRPPPGSAAKKVEVPASAPARGPKNAKVTIVEWSDFQCPFCSRVEPTLKEIEKSFGKDVRLVFRHQPLPFHPNAKPAAIASAAAHQQGKFWEFHDLLFSNQQALSDATYEKYAQELKLNLAKFKSALKDPEVAKLVEKDAQDGNAAGANGTPSFFINGRQVVGAQPFEVFKGIIEEELKKADKLLAEGVKAQVLYAKLNDQNVQNAQNLANAPAAAAPVQKIELGQAPVKGDKNAPVTVVAFSDFQCPFCARAVPTLKQIEESYGKKVKVAFKNQPLPFHQNARLAAAAALAANEQGKFWEYHDKLFGNQQALDRASLEKYAQELKLDMAKFKTALDSNKFESQIASEQAEANRVGANGTPTFFVNGRQLVGAQPFEAFKVIIDEELKKAGK